MAKSSEETRARIITATLETLRTEGIAGTSARAIARTGGFNQALIFYHFGSVDDLLLATMHESSRTRLARYRERLEGVQDLRALAAVAADLHREDLAEGRITILAQLLAGAVGKPDMGPPLLEAFDPWIRVVEDSLRNAVGGTDVENLVRLDDAAFAVTALFLGIELLTHLGEDPERSARLFATFEDLADLLQALGTSPPLETSDRDLERIKVTD